VSRRRRGGLCNPRVVASFLLLSLLPARAVAAVRYVTTTGVDNANARTGHALRKRSARGPYREPADTIRISSGTFTELFGVTVDKGLTIGRTGPFSTRVDGGAKGFSVFASIPGVTATIRLLEVRNGYAGTANTGEGTTNDGNLTLEQVRIATNSAHAQPERLQSARNANGKR
jgi:hypothetical protein